MRAIRTGLSAVLLALLSGCATLNVEVDVYGGPRQLLTRADATKLAIDTLADPAFDAAMRVKQETEYRKDLRARVFEHTRAALVANGSTTADQVALQTADGIDAAVAKELATLQQPALAVRNAAVTLTATLTTVGDADLAPPVTAFAQQRNVYDTLASGVRANLTKTFCTFTPPLCTDTAWLDAQYELHLRPASDSLIRRIAASARTTGRVVGYPIFDSEFQQLAAKNSNWKRFYTGRFTGSGGNTRFVVVRQGLVVFDQKSLDFDPTPTIGAATALTKAGLKLAASMALGKVVSTGQAKPGETKAAVSETQIINKAQMAAQKDAVEQRQTARLTALQLLAKTLKNVEAKGTLSGAEYEALKKEFISVLKEYQGRLALTEVPK